MEVRELIGLINIFDVKVVFDKPEKVKDNMVNGNILFFTPVEGDERTRYSNSKRKDDFLSTTASIHIPDLSIEYFINIFECDGTGLHEFTKNVIKPYCGKGVPEEIVYVIFLFLHEVGHWFQFNNLGRNVEKFTNLDADEYKDNFNKMQDLQKQHDERLKREYERLQEDYAWIKRDDERLEEIEKRICKLTAKEKRLFRQYMQEYREIPKEKEADEFAFNKIQEILELYKNSDMFLQS